MTMSIKADTADKLYAVIGAHLEETEGTTAADVKELAEAFNSVAECDSRKWHDPNPDRPRGRIL